MSKECLFLVPWTDLVRWIICSLFVISGNCLCCCHIVNTFVFLMNTVIDWSVTKCTSCWLVNQSLSDCLDNHFSLNGFCYTLIHVGQSLSHYHNIVFFTAWISHTPHSTHFWHSHRPRIWSRVKGEMWRTAMLSSRRRESRWWPDKNSGVLTCRSRWK